MNKPAVFIVAIVVFVLLPVVGLLAGFYLQFLALRRLIGL